MVRLLARVDVKRHKSRGAGRGKDDDALVARRLASGGPRGALVSGRLLVGSSSHVRNGKGIKGSGRQKKGKEETKEKQKNDYSNYTRIY